MKVPTTGEDEKGIRDGTESEESEEREESSQRFPLLA